MAFSIKTTDVKFEHPALSSPVLLEHRPDAPPTAMDADGTCHRLWPTSLVLSTFLCEHPELIAGKRVIELGSGSGAVGLVCAALGAASVTVTDMPDALELMARNVELNARPGGPEVRAAPCTWGDAQHLAALLAANGGGFDVVLCCEVVYQQSKEVLHALAQTQLALALPSAKILLGYEFRHGLFEDLAYFDAATELFGESEAHALDGAAAADLMVHEDDGVEDRFLYIYSVPPGKAGTVAAAVSAPPT